MFCNYALLILSTLMFLRLRDPHVTGALYVVTGLVVNIAMGILLHM